MSLSSLFFRRWASASALPSVSVRLRSPQDMTALPDDPLKLPFGTVFSGALLVGWRGCIFADVLPDHMLLYKWNVKSGWDATANIVPFGPISLLPSCNVFHYGQEVFEG